MKRFLLLASCAFVAGCVAPRTQMTKAMAAPTNENEVAGEGADLIVGGVGVERGKFDRLRDITFGTDGSLYTLETAGPDATTLGNIMGQGRVQIFSPQGQLQSVFSLGPDAQGNNAVNDKSQDGVMAAARIAVDSQNRVYVSFPNAGKVRVFEASGRQLADIPLPGAMALTRTRTGQVVALASNQAIGANGWEWQGGGALSLLGPTGVTSTIPLAQRMWNVQDMDFAPNGEFVVLGAAAANTFDSNPPTRLWRFSPSGQLLSSVGSGKQMRAEDGSEPLHSVVVEKDGSLVTMAYGNPASLVRYSSDGKTIVRRPGQFKWADPWSTHSSYTPLALDPSGRLWVAVPRPNDPGDPNLSMRHMRPVVLRTEANFFNSSIKGVLVSDSRTVGFNPRLETPLPYNISYAANSPIQASVVVPPAQRTLSSVNVSFRVLDAFGSVIAKGQAPLPLADNKESRLPINWTPPRFGSYSLIATYSAGTDTLFSQAMYFGVTPRFGNVSGLRVGDSTGGWEDPARQVFSGLSLMRLHPDKGEAKLLSDLDAAKARGATAFVQLTDKKALFTPERATQVMRLIKGRVRFLELFNEPNFQFTPEEYVARAKAVYAAIKAVDPTVQVLGPAVCSINLDWHEGFYKAGGKTTCDILTIHDYEGHESISPEHWKWKVGALRALMARYNDANKPIWQTERAIASVRGGVVTGLSQAIRITLHRDLLSSLGIPDAHNTHYYLNQGGYRSVPSYEWCDQGPLPSVMATRTRAALIGSRRWVSNLNFGTTGNTLFFGARYRDASGETLSLRNLIGDPLKTDYTVPSGARIEVFDAWGNRLPATPRAGTLSLTLSQLPTYVRISGGTLTLKLWNWGQDLALGAKVSVQGKYQNDPARLTNGKLETIHGGNLLGDTDGKAVLHLSDFSSSKPALVSLQMRSPMRFNHVVVRGLRADNQFGALRDFDVQVRQSRGWQTVGTYHANIPATVLARSADATAITFYGDDNAWIVSFPTVQSDALRLVVRDATRGFEPDDLARQEVIREWGGANPRAASLREIEIYNVPRS